MTTTYETRLEIRSWDEKAYRELADGSKFTRADVVLGGDDGISTATLEMVAYYRPDGTSSYVSLMAVSATLDGRSGTFVLQGQGGYDGTTATGRSLVVEGSGTDGMSGLVGSAESVSTHEDYPFMPLTLRFDLG